MLRFSSNNTSIIINDAPLHGIQSVKVRHKTGCDVLIKISRFIVGNDDELVNFMRSHSFALRMMEANSFGGYIAEKAEVSNFKMDLAANTTNNELLKQVITIKAHNFIYVADARSSTMKASEKEDLDNLVRILKQNQEKVKEHKAVLPTEKA